MRIFHRFSLAGRVALITGGGRGLGFEMAKALADAGAHVIINGRTVATLDTAIGIIQAYNDGLTWHMPGSDWTQSIVFAILILILVFRPEGLLGERTPEGA